MRGIMRLPVSLFRYEALMTLQPLADEAIEEIVDTIFLPLLDRRAPAAPTVNATPQREFAGRPTPGSTDH